ncbi:MAG TPA: hypothetical protein VIJ64_01430, partial [Candidatus Lustribacter sp.]
MKAFRDRSVWALSHVSTCVALIVGTCIPLIPQPALAASCSLQSDGGYVLLTCTTLGNPPGARLPRRTNATPVNTALTGAYGPNGSDGAFGSAGSGAGGSAGPDISGGSIGGIIGSAAAAIVVNSGAPAGVFLRTTGGSGGKAGTNYVGGSAPDGGRGGNGGSISV